MSITGIIRASECLTLRQKEEMLHLTKENRKLFAVMYKDLEETVKKDRNARAHIRKQLERYSQKRKGGIM